MKKTKGTISVTMIVSIILLVVSFIVILGWVVLSNPQGSSEKEICHNSVVAKGIKGVPAEVLPIKCSTEYLCISKYKRGYGNCDEMLNPAVEKAETKAELYDILADKMAECWWMFGEGSITYVDNTLTKNNYCSICSQILFDDSLKTIEGFESGTISKDDFYEYLTEKDHSDSQSYAQYLFGTNDIDGLKKGFSDNASANVIFGNIEIGKQYYLVTGITSEVSKVGWVLRGAVVGGAVVVGLATFGVGTAGFAAILVGEAAGGAAAGGISYWVGSPEIGAIVIDGKDVKNKFMVPTIQEAESDRYDSLNCEDVLTKS